MVDRLSVMAVGQNYLYMVGQAQSAQNGTTRAAFELQAGENRKHLLQLLHKVDREIYATLKALATELAEYGETDRFRALEREADRLDAVEVELHAYLDGHKPNGVSPEVKVNAEFVALATRARISAAARRFAGNGSRGSYDGDVIKSLVENGVAKEARHAIHVLNLSKGLAEGWSNEELLYWGLCYRRARDKGEGKKTAVAVANKALTVG